jgi:hypothetical protein
LLVLCTYSLFHRSSRYCTPLVVHLLITAVIERLLTRRLPPVVSPVSTGVVAGGPSPALPAGIGAPANVGATVTNVPPSERPQGSQNHPGA